MIKKIIITGGWGYGNIGDEAILKYTYLDLKKFFLIVQSRFCHIIHNKQNIIMV